MSSNAAESADAPSGDDFLIPPEPQPWDEAVSHTLSAIDQSFAIDEVPHGGQGAWSSTIDHHIVPASSQGQGCVHRESEEQQKEDVRTIGARFCDLTLASLRRAKALSRLNPELTHDYEGTMDSYAETAKKSWQDKPIPTLVPEGCLQSSENANTLYGYMLSDAIRADCFAIVDHVLNIRYLYTELLPTRNRNTTSAIRTALPGLSSPETAVRAATKATIKEYLRYLHNKAALSCVGRTALLAARTVFRLGPG